LLVISRSYKFNFNIKLDKKQLLNLIKIFTTQITREKYFK
jgi:hypothetical protein